MSVVEVQYPKEPDVFFVSLPFCVRNMIWARAQNAECQPRAMIGSSQTTVNPMNHLGHCRDIADRE